MAFEEKRNYESPIITIEKFEMEDIISASSLGNDDNNNNSYEIEDNKGWLPGWY